jgi:hypothetical protein
MFQVINHPNTDEPIYTIALADWLQNGFPDPVTHLAVELNGFIGELCHDPDEGLGWAGRTPSGAVMFITGLSPDAATDALAKLDASNN